MRSIYVLKKRCNASDQNTVTAFLSGAICMHDSSSEMFAESSEMFAESF
jgi:hypothetical protein